MEHRSTPPREVSAFPSLEPAKTSYYALPVSLCANPSSYTFEDAEDYPSLLGVYFAEFDNHSGPKIVSQFPNSPGIITPEDFTSVADLVISGFDMSHRIISVVIEGKYKLFGFPVNIPGEKYGRNSYYFNVGFIFHQRSNPNIYAAPLRALGLWLESVEKTYGYLVGVGLKFLRNSSEVSARTTEASTLAVRAAQNASRLPSHGSSISRIGTPPTPSTTTISISSRLLPSTMPNSTPNSTLALGNSAFSSPQPSSVQILHSLLGSQLLISKIEFIDTILSTVFTGLTSSTRSAILSLPQGAITRISLPSRIYLPPGIRPSLFWAAAAADTERKEQRKEILDTNHIYSSHTHRDLGNNSYLRNTDSINATSFREYITQRQINVDASALLSLRQPYCHRQNHEMFDSATFEKQTQTQTSSFLRAKKRAIHSRVFQNEIPAFLHPSLLIPVALSRSPLVTAILPPSLSLPASSTLSSFVDNHLSLSLINRTLSSTKEQNLSQPHAESEARALVLSGFLWLSPPLTPLSVMRPDSIVNPSSISPTLFSACLNDVSFLSTLSILCRKDESQLPSSIADLSRIISLLNGVLGPATSPSTSFTISSTEEKQPTRAMGSVAEMIEELDMNISIHRLAQTLLLFGLSSLTIPCPFLSEHVREDYYDLEMVLLSSTSFDQSRIVEFIGEQKQVNEQMGWEKTDKSNSHLCLSNSSQVSDQSLLHVESPPKKCFSCGCFGIYNGEYNFPTKDQSTSHRNHSYLASTTIDNHKTSIETLTELDHRINQLLQKMEGIVEEDLMTSVLSSPSTTACDCSCHFLDNTCEEEPSHSINSLLVTPDEAEIIHPASLVVLTAGTVASVTEYTDPSSLFPLPLGPTSPPSLDYNADESRMAEYESSYLSTLNASVRTIRSGKARNATTDVLLKQSVQRRELPIIRIASQRLDLSRHKAGLTNRHATKFNEDNDVFYDRKDSIKAISDQLWSHAILLQIYDYVSEYHYARNSPKDQDQGQSQDQGKYHSIDTDYHPDIHTRPMPEQNSQFDTNSSSSTYSYDPLSTDNLMHFCSMLRNNAALDDTEWEKNNSHQNSTKQISKSESEQSTFQRRISDPVHGPILRLTCRRIIENYATSGLNDIWIPDLVAYCDGRHPVHELGLALGLQPDHIYVLLCLLFIGDLTFIERQT